MRRERAHGNERTCIGNADLQATLIVYFEVFVFRVNERQSAIY
jgi:hypothetical protein